TLPAKLPLLSSLSPFNSFKPFFFLFEVVEVCFVTRGLSVQPCFFLRPSRCRLFVRRAELIFLRCTLLSKESVITELCRKLFGLLDEPLRPLRVAAFSCP